MHYTDPEYSRSFLNTASVRLRTISVEKFFSPLIVFSHPPRCVSSFGLGGGAGGTGGWVAGAAGVVGTAGGCARAAVSARSKATSTRPVCRMLSPPRMSGAFDGQTVPGDNR